ncbi:MAG: response regulator [Xenococcaceae cyanobacterium]
MNPPNGDFNTNISANETTKQTIRILLVDDQKMIREGLKALLITQPDLEVVGTADNGESAVEQVEKLKPDVVLMDMEMPGLDGVSATKIICSRFPEIKILVLSTYDNNEYITQSISAGAMGYILKGTPAKDLTEAIRSINRGYAQIGPGAFQKILPLVSQSQLEKVKSRSPSSSSTREQTMGASFGDSPAARAGGIATREQISAKTTTNGSSPSSALAVKNKGTVAKKFDSEVVLRQSPKWSRAIIWSIIGVTTFGLLWASFAKIEQVVPAQGQLKPEGKVQEIQAPLNGVVKQVHVKDGERVKQGQVLISFDTTASTAELQSQSTIRKTLQEENQFYRALMDNPLPTFKAEAAIAKYNIPREIASLARNRIALATENELFRTQIGIKDGKKNLDAEQLARLDASQSESSTRSAAAQLDVEQFQKQLSQNQVQLADAKDQLVQAKQTLTEIEARNKQTLAQLEDSLKLEKDVLGYVEPLVREGVVSKIQVDRQRQEANDRYAKLVEQKANGSIEYNRQKQEVQKQTAEISRLQEEEQRLRFAVAQAKQKYSNTTFLTKKDVLDKIGENQKRLAEIDSQIVKAIVDNDKQIADLNSKISSTEQTLKYQELRAPVNGTVFDLKALPGYVQPPAGQSEPILKIVPNDGLIAEVYITNQDIGFVRPGMITDVRIDTFPFSEFGDIKGKVKAIGSDSLPPDQTYNFFRFPTKVELNSQSLPYRDQQIPLQSGMSISVNIKVRENRTVMSLFTEQFAKDVDRFKEMR